MVRRSSGIVERRHVDNKKGGSLALGGVWILPGFQAFCCRLRAWKSWSGFILPEATETVGSRSAEWSALPSTKGQGLELLPGQKSQT